MMWTHFLIKAILSSASCCFFKHNRELGTYKQDSITGALTRICSQMGSPISRVVQDSYSVMLKQTDYAPSNLRHLTHLFPLKRRHSGIGHDVFVQVGQPVELRLGFAHFCLRLFVRRLRPVQFQLLCLSHAAAHCTPVRNTQVNGRAPTHKRTTALAGTNARTRTLTSWPHWSHSLPIAVPLVEGVQNFVSPALPCA
jgi:hypothetical protein